MWLARLPRFRQRQEAVRVASQLRFLPLCIAVVQTSYATRTASSAASGTGEESMALISQPIFDAQAIDP